MYQKQLFRILLAGIFGAITIPAQENLSLQQAASINPQLAVSRAQIDDAHGQQVQAGFSPNPRLVVQSEDFRSWGPQPRSFGNTTEDYGYIGQVFESGGKRGRRVDVAASAVRRTEFELELTRRQILANVSAAYWAAAGAARMRNLFQENVHTYDDDVAYVRNRVNEGVMAEADLMKIELERDRAQADLLSGAREADQALINLYHAIGRTDFPQTTFADSLDNVPRIPPPDSPRALEGRPELHIAQASVDQARANIRLQKSNAKPDPEAFFGYKRDVTFDTLYAAVQIDLPVRNRNQGNIVSAEAQLRAAQANVAAIQANLKAELESALRAYQDESRLLQTLPAMRARAEESERLARAAYREGAIDLVRMLDAIRSRIQIELEYSRALVALQQAIVNLKFAGGESLEGSLVP